MTNHKRYSRPRQALIEWRRPSTLIALTAAALLVALAGCSGGSKGPPSSLATDDGITPFAQLIAQMPGGSGDTSSIIAAAPVFERDILADGKVTFDEYQKAVFATVQCAKAHGIVYLNDPTLGPGKKFTYLMSFGQTADEAQSLHKAYDACYQQYQYLIDIAWTIENKPTQETLNKATSTFASCLRDAGVTLPDSPSTADFRTAQASHPDVFNACSTTVSKQFDLQDFSP